MDLRKIDLENLKEKLYEQLTTLSVELRQYKRKSLKANDKIMLVSGTNVETADYIRNVEKAVKNIEEKIEIVNDFISEYDK
jgi:hypothetical protein